MGYILPQMKDYNYKHIVEININQLHWRRVGCINVDQFNLIMLKITFKITDIKEYR